MAGEEAAIKAWGWGMGFGGPGMALAMAILSGAATTTRIVAIAATPPPSMQTAHDTSRFAPGPSTRESNVIVHGGEEVGRGGTEVVIRVEGSDNLTQAIASSLRVYTKRTGVVLQGA
jgi:hypothetical protein